MSTIRTLSSSTVCTGSAIRDILSNFFPCHRIVRQELLIGKSLDFAELSGGLDLESALIYDAVHLLAVSLSQLRDIQRIEPLSIDCGTHRHLPRSWHQGSSILNIMRVSDIPGLSR